MSAADPRARWISQHAPIMMLVQAVRVDPAVRLSVDQAIDHAAALYDRLVARGLLPGPGAPAGPRETKPRATVDYLARLDPEQRAAYQAFYRAYWRGGRAQGLQRGAMRWAELAPDATTIAQIMAAASADAAAPRPEGAVRKHPEGWLAERRWEDHTPAAAPDPGAERAATVRALLSERSGLARLVTAAPTDALTRQLADIDARLHALGYDAPIYADRRPAPGTPAPIASLLGRHPGPSDTAEDPA